MTVSKTALSLAAVAAVMALGNFAASATASAKDAKVVHCYGVNSCKAMSDCKSGKHDCKAMNDCKGQGFKDLTAQACTQQGGSLTEPKG